MWPLNMSDAPPPAPSPMPTTLARPSSTSCHCTCRPIAVNVSRINWAMASSDPVKLGVAIARLAHSTSRSASTATGGAATDTGLGRGPHAREVRQHVLAEQPQLLVPVRAPELEHHVRAAGVAILVDRLDALGRRARDRPALVEQRVAHLLLRRQPAPALHRVGHGPDLLGIDLRELEQRVGRAADVLHL